MNRFKTLLLVVFGLVTATAFSQTPAFSEEKQADLKNRFIKAIPPGVSEEAQEEFKTKLSSGLAITKEEIERTKAEVFSSPGWSSIEDGFAVKEISQKPAYAEVDLPEGKVKRFEWSEITKETFFVFKVLIGAEYHFDDSALSYEKRLDSMKEAVIVMGKMGGGKILNTEISKWGAIDPVISFVAETTRSNVPCRRIYSAFSHRNRLWQVGIEYPVQSKGNPIEKFNWFLSQLKLF